MCHPLRAAIVEEEEREARRLCGLCLASDMDGAPVRTSSRGEPWLPRLMMLVDRLAAHPSPLNDPHASFVLFCDCESTPSRDVTLLQVDTPPSAGFGHNRVALSNKVRRCCCWRRRKRVPGERKQDPGEEKIRRLLLSLCHVLTTLLQQAINTNTAPLSPELPRLTSKFTRFLISCCIPVIR
ncbi:hypothetical protein BDP81DRAFT_223520 [Colletotrichum phormii]|uniref:Uncharacterized protein n=1 Tax=Colletotrichum phormii TaxID=359342 RepID=A0AAI9ZSK7_9PEZI|nr:uncharacterized protein BDP81DRAFT_223520 [Colletotrichum phormii]KAK1637414.1 hypothetical protein BDP81DRAFT_223520 [Colletotrichum phormii]